jgi:hypothetical protein
VSSEAATEPNKIPDLKPNDESANSRDEITIEYSDDERPKVSLRGPSRLRRSNSSLSESESGSLSLNSDDDDVADEYKKFCAEEVVSATAVTTGDLPKPDVEEPVIWYKPVTLPRPTAFILCEPSLSALLCDFCRDLQNVVVGKNDNIICAICESCRSRVRRHEFFHCTGGYSGCEVYRFIDAIGSVAPLCKACHQYFEHGYQEKRKLERIKARRARRAGRMARTK